MKPNYYFLWLTLILTVLMPTGIAQAQLLAIPVMDVARREGAAVYDDYRDTELVQQTLEWAYDLINGMGLDEMRFRDVVTTLDAASGILYDAASLGYNAADLAATFETAFDINADADFATVETQRIEALLRTYEAMASTGPLLADDLEATAAFIDDLKSQIEEIGENVFGYEGLGSHGQSAQAEVPVSIYSAEEMLHLRQSIAMQTNADIIQYADEIALDQLRRQILRRALYGPPAVE